MKLQIYVSVVSALLVLYEAKPWTRSTPIDWTTTASPGVNLTGKMVTLSQLSMVTFHQPKYDRASQESAEKSSKIKTPATTLTQRPTPQFRGVSVCLRFMSEFSSFTLFRLSHGAPLYFSLRDLQSYTLSLGRSVVSLNPQFFLWSSVWTEPWTSVCMVLDSYKNVVQVFQGGAISIRKIPPFWMVWSGEPVLDMSGFDGQVKDLEVWDYPLMYLEVFRYMQNYGAEGTVLTWSNINYTTAGDVLVEDTYIQSPPMSRSQGEEQPIRSSHGRNQLYDYRKMFNAVKQSKMF